MSDYILCHHGVKGQKWGVRRYQNPDGTLTAAGKRKVERQEFSKDKWAVRKASFQKGRTSYTPDGYEVYIPKKWDVTNEIAQRKGKEYADKVVRTSDLEDIYAWTGSMAVSAAIAVGAVYVADKLGN